MREDGRIKGLSTFAHWQSRQSIWKKAARLVLSVVLLSGAGLEATNVFGQASNDITFFVGSDLHYGYVDATHSCADISRGALDRMNALPGQPLPASLGGGLVDTPRGVLLPGDLTHESALTQWNAFTNDWGLNGEGRLRFPIYEGFGNHDLYNDIIPNAIRARNPLRTGVSHISTNGFHYSWDWGVLHLVCLNLCAGNELDLYSLDPRHSLDFLVDDLANRVGTSGRPVILYQHYAFDWASTNYWWSEQQRSNLFQAIKNYNVIAILAGHTHDVNFTSWRGLTTYTDGSLGYFDGNFFVVHMTQTNLTLVERRADNTWGKQFTQPITIPGAPIIREDPHSASVRTGSSITLSVAAMGPALAYQWRFNTSQALTGATNSSLTLTNFGPAQVGPYTVVVTNSAGSVTSQPALLSLVAPGIAMRLNLSGPVGSTWRIDYVNDLSSGSNQWLSLATVTLTNTSQAYYDYSALTQSHRFYRVVPVP